jgi:HEAT repeat protein
MRARACYGLVLCLLACGGCGRTKSTAELVKDLKSPQDRDRTIAIRQLPNRKGDAAQAVPALIEALKNIDGGVRVDAAIGLGTFGEQAKAAIPALKIAQHDRDGRVRNAANVALSRIDPERFPLGSNQPTAKGK